MSWALSVIYIFADPPHAALQSVAHAEFAPELLHVDRLAFVGEGGVAGDDETVRQVREVGGEIVGDPVGEIVLVRVAAQDFERQDDDREPRRVRQ